MTNRDSQVTQAILNEGIRPPHQDGNKFPQYYYSIAATMSAFCIGTALAWTGPALQVIVVTGNQTTDDSAPLSITREQGSWVGAILAVGALMGALPAGSIANLFGRKLVCASLSLPFIISWLMISFSSSVWLLYLARFIIGVATGASSALAPMYIGEIAESSIRGTLGSYFQLMITGGILYTYTVGAIFSYTTLGLLCAVVPIIFILMFLSAPETPTYLLSKGRQTEAKASLRKLRGDSYDINYELNELQRELQSSSSKNTSMSSIFRRKAVLRGLLISLGLMTFQQLSGINAVIFYANSIFKDAGSTISPSVSTIIIGVVQVIFTYISSLLVDKTGRRILLLISGTVMAICHGLLGFYFYFQENGHDVSSITLIPLASVALYIIIFSIGYGPIPWMMSGELFGSDVKGIATGIAAGLNWFLVFLVTKTFDPLQNILGIGFTYGIFCVICTIGVFFVMFIVPETKGRSLEEIQQILAGNGNKGNPV